jgi:hypothetical protein
MTKKLGLFLLLGFVVAFLGYQALNAASGSKQGLVNSPTANHQEPTAGSAKVTDEDMQVARDRALKDSLGRVAQMQDLGEAADNSAANDPEAIAEAEKYALEENAIATMAKLQTGEPISSFEKEELLKYLEQHPGGSDQSGSGRNPLDYVGGPDASNYFYVDNQNGDSATYDWIELRGNGETYINSWTSHDDGYSYVGAASPGARHPIGFSFPFYGVNQDSFRLCTNGFLQFATTATSLSNGALPNTGVGGPAIFPYWDDLHLDRNGQTTNQVMYRNFGDYTVIEYDSIGVYNSTCGAGGPTNTLKYEVILFSDGKIKIQYNIVAVCDAQDSSMTVGIQSNGAAGSPALQYGYGSGGQTLVGHLPASGTAIWFYRYFYSHDFGTITVLSPTGSYGPGAVVNVTARFLNQGTTTESSPVSYVFNGGGVVTEATAVLAPLATEDHPFATPITLPGAIGSYPLTVWSDVANDSAHGNDTLHVNVIVFSGDDCPAAILITPVVGVPDSATFNNTGATNNTPGQYCGSSGGDMVWTVSVPDGHQLDMWETLGNGSLDSRHTMKWGGCPTGQGNILDCIDDPDNQRFRYVNHTGSAQNVYLVAGYFSTGSFGNLVIAWSDSVPAAAPVPTSGTPFVENFDVNTPDATRYPAGWSIENSDQLGTPWRIYTTSPRSAPRCASIPGLASGNNDWLFSNGVNMTGGVGYVLEFWWRGNSTTIPESLEVKAGTSNASAAMTLNVMGMDSIKRTVYVQRVSNFTPASTGIYYFGWHNVTHQSSGRSYIDDIQVYPSGSCSAPTVTVNSVIAQDSAALVANIAGGSGGPPQYQWFTGEACQEANRILGATSATYYAHTSGIFSCRAWIIDSVNCASCDSAIATVINCQAPTALPFSENFTTTTPPALPVCWHMENVNGDAQYWQTSSGTYICPSGGNYAWIRYTTAGTGPEDDWLYLPPMQFDAGVTYVLTYLYRMAWSTQSYTEALEVGFGDAPTHTAMTNVIQGPFNFTNITCTDGGGTFTPPSSGVYYVGFHAISIENQGGITLDDIQVIVGGTCTAPTANVADSSRVGSVNMFCSASGGSGGPLEYQWYTGQTCTPGNEIAGANAATYSTTVTGDYACKAWRFDPDNCSACDWGHAEVLPPPPGETCNNPIVLTPPAPLDSTIVSSTTLGLIADCRDTCNGGISVFTPDIFYSLTLESCRRITMSLQYTSSSGDMQISVAEAGHCCGMTILCDDDLSEFPAIPWETPGQRPAYSLASFVGGELAAGTYIIRCSYYGSSGPFTLKVYDNGPCACDIVCQNGDVAEAAEDRYDWTFFQTDPDGGCNDLTPFPMGTIAVGQTVCGVGFDYLHGGNEYRDTDWYTFTLAQSATMNFTVEAEFPAHIGIIAGTACPASAFVVQDTTPECVPTMISANLTAGDYVAFVGPAYFVGSPRISTYRATLQNACDPDTVVNLTAYLVNADSDPTANDIRLKWTAETGFTGTYSVYTNTTLDPAFPGTWQLLASDIPPVVGPNNMTYIHDDGATSPKRFYLVISQCAGAFVTSTPIPAPIPVDTK